MFETVSPNPEKQMIEVLIKHLEELRRKAVKEHPTKDLEKFWAFYSGEEKEGENQNQYNVIKGIIDSKKTLILENEIVSTVMPRLKTFVDQKGLALQNDIADILRDINAFVLDQNSFDKVKSDVVLDKLVYSIGVTETIWEQNENELGDIRINSIDPLNFFPDMSAKRIEDCNYAFIRESYSPITLKKKYPNYAEKIKETTSKEGQSDNSKGKPSGTVTLQNDYNTTQAYTYRSDGISPDKQKNVTVWKCYLKDDSTFVAKETEDGADPRETELRFAYPNGRLIIYVDGAKDYILEDKPIDYPFGFPIDIYSSNSKKLFSPSDVKYLIPIQQRINKAFDRVQFLVAAYLSAVAVDGHTFTEPEDIINEAIVICETVSAESFQNITNNTLSELKSMIEYIDKLEAYAYKIARVNPMMISGERPKGVTSGEQITQLNESPMLSIKEDQGHFKYFVCGQGQKNISLIQLFYNTPRMIRLTNSKQVAQLPAIIDTENPDNAGLQQQPIQIWEQRENREVKQPDGTMTVEQGTYYEAVREIRGDLSIGEYDMQVIAGTEMPRSRGERANITGMLWEKGVFGDPMSADATEIYLTALDFPLRHQVVDKKRKAEAEMEKAPPPEPPTKDIAVNFKDLHPTAQGEWYEKHGFIKAAGLFNSPEYQNLQNIKENEELLNDNEKQNTGKINATA